MIWILISFIAGIFFGVIFTGLWVLYTEKEEDKKLKDIIMEDD